MPIHKSQKKLYPKDWKAISARIRFVRAENKCEWCKAENYQPHPITGSKVILTVAHLDHNPANCIESNLAALCQWCHNNYDRANRLLNAKTRKAVKTPRGKQQQPLPLKFDHITISDAISRVQKRFSTISAMIKRKPS